MRWPLGSIRRPCFYRHAYDTSESASSTCLHSALFLTLFVGSQSPDIFHRETWSLLDRLLTPGEEVPPQEHRPLLLEVQQAPLELALPLALRLSLPLEDRLGLRMAQQELTRRQVLYSNLTWSRKLDQIVADFKADKLTRARAIALLVVILLADVPGAVPAAETALESYISILESHSAAIKGAGDRGAHPPGQGGTSGGPDGSGDGGAGNPNKRPRALDSDNESEGETEQQGRSSKKQLIFEHELPWFADNILAGAILSPELQKTQEILLLFSRDLAATERFVATSVSHPSSQNRSGTASSGTCN
ncbi:hypothetical protein B0H14DRAFT_3428069 [Mycena olivaceomarginata]|nr:hypothetical protein B0H14DRAFT_3428069 [Mycena olivaceomarginata]